MNGNKKFLPLLLLLLLAALLTWYDGISRALDDGMVDFNILYVGSDLFLDGENPYFSGYLQEYLGPSVKNSLGVQITLPGAFALMAPLTLFDHGTASTIWLVLNLFSMVASVILLLKLTGLRFYSTCGLLLVSSCLMLGSFRMGIRQGQLDNMILLFILLVVTLLRQQGSAQRLPSAIFLGVAVALKPTSAGLFSIYLLMRGKVTVAIASLLISSAIIGIGLLLLTIRVPDWSVEYLRILNSVENNFNKVNALNPRLELLTHLPAGVFSVLKSSFWASVISFAICLPILFRTLLSSPLVGVEDSRETFLRELSIIALVSLLIVYHRFYSGVFLVFPVAWAVYCISKGNQGLSAWLILSLLPVLSIVNGQAAYSYLVENEVIGLLSGSSWLEQTILRFHFVWIQLAALLLLFLIQIRNTEPSFAPAKDAFITVAHMLSVVTVHRGVSGCNSRSGQRGKS